jgi:hypothetical protein
MPLEPLALIERAATIAGCALGLGLVLSLLSRKRLTFPFALWWIGALLACGVAAALWPLIGRAGALVLGARARALSDLGGGALVAVLIAFLLYLSVKLSILTHRFEELAQRIGIIEYGLEERISAGRGDEQR